MSNGPFMSRLDVWNENLKEKIAFFRRRKQWARELLKKAKLAPGSSIQETFEGDTFQVSIGPRGGIKILGRHKFM